VDAPAEGHWSVHDISVSADGLRASYGVEIVDERGVGTPQIRMVDEQGECTLLLENCGWPDAAPAAG